MVSESDFGPDHAYPATYKKSPNSAPYSNPRSLSEMLNPKARKVSSKVSSRQNSRITSLPAPALTVRRPQHPPQHRPAGSDVGVFTRPIRRDWLPDERNGILNGFGFGQSDFMWFLRLRPKVKVRWFDLRRCSEGTPVWGQKKGKCRSGEEVTLLTVGHSWPLALHPEDSQRIGSDFIQVSVTSRYCQCGIHDLLLLFVPLWSSQNRDAISVAMQKQGNETKYRDCFHQ